MKRINVANWKRDTRSPLPGLLGRPRVLISALWDVKFDPVAFDWSLGGGDLVPGHRHVLTFPFPPLTRQIKLLSCLFRCLRRSAVWILAADWQSGINSGAAAPLLNIKGLLLYVYAAPGCERSRPAGNYLFLSIIPLLFIIAAVVPAGKDIDWASRRHDERRLGVNMSSWLFFCVCVCCCCFVLFFLWKWISVEAATHMHQPLVLCALYIFKKKKKIQFHQFLCFSFWFWVTDYHTFTQRSYEQPQRPWSNSRETITT